MKDAFVIVEDVVRMPFKGLRLPEPYRTHLGEIPPDCGIFIWGLAGSGKTTLALDIAADIGTVHGPVLFVAAEQGGPSMSIKEKILRLNIRHLPIYVQDFAGFETLKHQAQELGAQCILLDSITHIDGRGTLDVQDLMDWCKNRNIILILIAHARKEGKTYLGGGGLSYFNEVNIHVFLDEKTSTQTATVTKNRFAIVPTTFPVRMTAKRQTKRKTKTVDANPINARIFTLRQIVENGKKSFRRSVTLLDSALGHTPGCRLVRHSGESVDARVQLHSTKNYSKREHTLALVVDGVVSDNLCADNQRSLISAFVAKWGDRLRFEISDQEHLRYIFGADKYRKIERAEDSSRTNAPVKKFTRRKMTPTKPRAQRRQKQKQHPSSKKLGASRTSAARGTGEAKNLDVTWDERVARLESLFEDALQDA